MLPGSGTRASPLVLSVLSLQYAGGLVMELWLHVWPGWKPPSGAMPWHLAATL